MRALDRAGVPSWVLGATVGLVQIALLGVVAVAGFWTAQLVLKRWEEFRLTDLACIFATVSAMSLIGGIPGNGVLEGRAHVAANAVGGIVTLIYLLLLVGSLVKRARAVPERADAWRPSDEV